MFEITPSQSGIAYKLAGTNHQFEMPKLDVPGVDEPVLYFQGATEAVGDFFMRQRDIHADVRLSPIGRDEKLAPLKRQALETLAATSALLDNYDASTAKREAKLLAVPVIESTNAVVPAREAEIRSWWRGLSMPERTKLLDKIGNEPGHEELELALLRSPYALHDMDTAVVRDSWERGRRLSNPGEAVAIGNAKAGLEWARRGLGQLIGIANRFVGWEKDQVLRTLMTSENETARAGVKVLGFGEPDIAQMKMRLAHERLSKV